VLLATENAPPGKRAWFGMFPQLGAPVGFLASGGIFLVLSRLLSEEQFLSYGWRLPFIASSLLVLVGLYVRLNITETPAFQATLAKQEREAVPLLTVLKTHGRGLVLGTASALATFLIFYLLTVFCLSWGTSKLGYGREKFLLIQMVGVLFFAATIPLSAVLADRHGRRITMLVVSGAMLVYGLAFGAVFELGVAGVVATQIVGFALMGMTYGPLGTVLAELFPTAVRYTGASLAFNLAGIFGASLAPSIATWLALNHGLDAVGYYLSAATVLSLVALWLGKETRDNA
jgi:MFS family permease